MHGIKLLQRSADRGGVDNDGRHHDPDDGGYLDLVGSTKPYRLRDFNAGAKGGLSSGRLSSFSSYLFDPFDGSANGDCQRHFIATFCAPIRAVDSMHDGLSAPLVRRGFGPAATHDSPFAISFGSDFIAEVSTAGRDWVYRSAGAGPRGTYVGGGVIILRVSPTNNGVHPTKISLLSSSCCGSAPRRGGPIFSFKEGRGPTLTEPSGRFTSLVYSERFFIFLSAEGAERGGDWSVHGPALSFLF